MAVNKKQAEPEEQLGAPEWMVTFSDCMTLLLTFFVLLLSFSSFDDLIFRQLKVIFADALPSVSLKRIRDKDAFLAVELIQYQQEIDKGSEKPTLERGVESNLKKETEPANFYNRKVFLISSDKIFWGRGTIISIQGVKTLSAMSAFLREVPNRIVISENGSEDGVTDESFGLKRAYAVMRYFTTKQGLEKGRFNIAASTLQDNLKSDEQTYRQAKAERMLEIVLLERSICN
jgi:chemotaxis protein MotB